jgi:hypothetical protein
MNVTKLAGWILIAYAAVYLLTSIASFGPKYAAAGAIGDKAEKYGLQTNDTNLRFKMGLDFFVDVLIVGVVALAGWWLTTSEVRQVMWIVGIGIVTLVAIVVRATPVLPLPVIKAVPGAAFYGAQLQVVIAQDVADQYVPISRKEGLRTAIALDATGQKQLGNVILDLSSTSAATQYQGCQQLPLTVLGTSEGKGCIAKGTDLWSVPMIKVVGAASGLPKK